MPRKSKTEKNSISSLFSVEIEEKKHSKEEKRRKKTYKTFSIKGQSRDESKQEFEPNCYLKCNSRFLSLEKDTSCEIVEKRKIFI